MPPVYITDINNNTSIAPVILTLYNGGFAIMKIKVSIENLSIMPFLENNTDKCFKSVSNTTALEGIISDLFINCNNPSDVATYYFDYLKQNNK